VRIVSMLTTHLWTPLDAVSFRHVAEQLGRWDLRDYVGDRTPIFPLLLILSGGNDRVTWLLHSILGCTSAALLAYVTYEETRRVWLAFVAGAFIGVGFYALCFEAAIMSECSALALLSGALFLTRRILMGSRGWRSMVLLALLTGLLVLSRPMFCYLIPLFGLALRECRSRDRAAFVGVSCGVVLAWSLFNWSQIGYFGPTTLLGFNLTNHVGAFIERAPPEYVDIRDVYLRYRAVRMATVGAHMQTIWDAIPEMVRVTGLPFVTLSKRCLAMSLDLIVHNPWSYAKGVAQAYGRFLFAPNCRNASWLPPRGPLLSGVWDVQEAFFIAPKMALHALMPLAVWRRSGSSFTRVVTWTVLGGGVFQALVELGENDRYSVPLQPWAACAVILLASNLALPRPPAAPT
jgi:hypothetical protein